MNDAERNEAVKAALRDEAKSLGVLLPPHIARLLEPDQDAGAEQA